MENMFYIICVNKKEDWWQLRLKGSHLVLSCTSTKEKILECLYNIVKRYKKAKNLRRAVSRMEMYNEGATNMQLYQEQYLKEGDLYLDEIEETVKRAEEEIRGELIENSPVVKNKKRISAIRPKNTKLETKPLHKEKREEVEKPPLPKKRVGLKKVKPLLGKTK